MTTVDIHTIFLTLSRLEEQMKQKIIETKEKGDLQEAIRLQSKREGVKMSITVIKRLSERRIEAI